MEEPLELANTTRRDVLRKTVFIAPVVLTLPVIPSFAKAGSDDGRDQDGQGHRGDQDDRDESGISGGSKNGRRRRHHHWWFLSW